MSYSTIKRREHTETVIVDGVNFHRNPRAKSWPGKMYYRGTVNGKRVRLHIYLFKKHFGEIKRGYVVHHIDGDPLNNNPSNLESLPKGEHISHHTRLTNQNPDILAKRCNGLSRALKSEGRKKWVTSDAMKELGRRNAKYLHQDKRRVESICVVCGITHRAFPSPKGLKYCSNKCAAKSRRDSGVDDIESKCHHCGSVYKHSRFIKRQFCSRDCAVIARRANPGGLNGTQR